MLNVIGISAYFHDSAAALLQDGMLVAAAEEERFTRRKHDSRLPVEAFQYCLQEGGISLAEVDSIAFYENSVSKMGRQLWTELTKDSRDFKNLSGLDPRRPEREIRDILGYEGPIVFADHHKSHAASSYLFSGFDEAAILVVDGVGEWATTTYGYGNHGAFKILEEVTFPDSLGLLYSTITSYLGFDVNDGEYKVMGLASYGTPEYAPEMRRICRSQPRGGFSLDLKYFDFTNHIAMFSDALPELFGHPPRCKGAPLTPFHRNVARSLQHVLEELLVEKVRYLHGLTGSKNLCMAGGVALNCVANSRILAEGPFERLFVQPSAGDAGCAIGAAAIAYSSVTGTVLPKQMMSNAFLGPAFSTSSIRKLVQSAPIRYSDFSGNETGLLRETVRRLEAGEVVGWLNGRMEFGPRALGARSILADPRRPEMQDRINRLIKIRESFRPFAPVVLLEKAADHFELDHPSPFMLEIARVRSKLDLPAITHIDGSARVQTISGKENCRLARLLLEFERATGCPILLNTSFNVQGEPIVCTPADALNCFVSCQIDALILEDFVIDRRGLPSNWTRSLTSFDQKWEPWEPQSRDGAVSNTVYTLM
jgi:carbamoyltransferase